VKKKLILKILVVLSVLVSYWSHAFASIDPFLQMNLPVISVGKNLTAATDISWHRVLVRTHDINHTKSLISDLDGRIHMSTSDILTATLPSDAINILANDAQTIHIEGDTPISIYANPALTEINGDSVHLGQQLPSAYTGKNVIIGVIDTGADITHTDFQNEDGSTRILYLWDQTGDGHGPDEVENSYGNECDAADIDDNQCTFQDTNGHGTHVTGIAASNDPEYTGVAPESDIIIVRYNPVVEIRSGMIYPAFSTNICDAAFYIFSKAKELNRPAVINLSLGTHIGAHDGTSLFEMCLSNLVQESPGRAIVAAAGNEHHADEKSSGIHTGFQVDGMMATNFKINHQSLDDIYYMDIWADEKSEIDIALAMYMHEPSVQSLIEKTDFASPGDIQSYIFLNGAVEIIIHYAETPSVQNNKFHAGIMMIVDPELIHPYEYSFDLIVSGNGEFNAWLFPSDPPNTIQFTTITGDQGLEWTYQVGDKKMSIAIPATSPNIIAVTGYTSQNTWTSLEENCCQVEFTLDTLLPYASHGPSADASYTGIKPEIAAPGGIIASSLSSQASAVANTLITRDHQHMYHAGTSMAAPFVSGTVALLFELHPDLSASDIKTIITQAAYADDHTTEVPNNLWGYGKLDVMKSIEIGLDYLEITPGVIDENEQVQENNNVERVSSMSTSGSCQLIDQHTYHYNDCAFVLCLILLMFGIRRRYFNTH